MPSNHIQVVHKDLARRAMGAEKRADSPACSNIYLSPTMGQVVNSLDPLPITWNSTCLSVQEIDIYLYSPNAALPRIHVWENVALSRGTYNATLLPRWWNSTATQSLQVSIVPAGQPPFLSQFPGGPVFNATYTTPASGTPAAADTAIVSSGITQVNDLANAKNALTPGKKAAAALLTLLFVALCIAAYIKIRRNKGKKERRRWTEAVDKRMSTISTDWKSVSVAGANAAIRNSIAVGNRSSSFSFGSIRPPSTFVVQGDDEKRSMSQMRTGVGLRNPAAPASTERVSRVSFAPDTRISRASVADSRPSGESRRTRAFHTGYVPPVPSLPADDESDSGSLSPRQSQGPLTLTTDDIRARTATNKRAPSTTPNSMSNSANDMDEVMPALRMMRTGGDPSTPDDFLLKAPIPPVPAVPKSIIASTPPQRTASPAMSSMAMEAIPANVMSPDDMLRAYAAERKKSISAPSSSSLSSHTSISYPKAIAKKVSMKSSKHKRMGSNTMRVLYNATTGSLSSNDAAYGGMDEQSTGRQSASSIAEEVGTGANANPFGYHPGASIGIDAYEGAQYAIGDDEVDAGVAGRGTGAGTHYVGRAA